MINSVIKSLGVLSESRMSDCVYLWNLIKMNVLSSLTVLDLTRKYNSAICSIISWMCIVSLGNEHIENVIHQYPRQITATA